MDLTWRLDSRKYFPNFCYLRCFRGWIQRAEQPVSLNSSSSSWIHQLWHSALIQCACILIAMAFCGHLLVQMLLECFHLQDREQLQCFLNLGGLKSYTNLHWIVRLFNFSQNLPSKKLMVNHEYIPSSIPSNISTELSLTKNPDRKNTSRASLSRFSASMGNSNRRPAVAFSTNGVFAHNSFGTKSFAFSSSDRIVWAPCIWNKKSD